MKHVALFFALTLSATAQDKAVTVKQENGGWWFHSPAGANFLSIGTNQGEPLYWQSSRNAESVQFANNLKAMRGFVDIITVQY